jgi:hypothetical protein
VSSILEALRKVEAREERRPIRLPPPAPRPRARLALLVALAAFVAGAVAVAMFIAFRPGASPEPDETQVASATPPAEPAATPPPVPAAPTPAETAPVPSAPGAQVVSPPPAATDATAAPLVAPVDEAAVDELPADPDVPEQITILRPAPEAAAEPDAPEAEVTVEAIPAPARAEPPVEVLPGPPKGAPEIHVSFLIYSAVPERRVVTMTINSGPLVTLHEGQRSGEISLVRILRDRIHVDHNGRIYSVRAVL